MARCNIPPEEREEILKSPVFSERTAEELQECRLLFPQYCFIETWGEKDWRSCRCSACEGRWETERAQDKAFFSLHHGDSTVCPFCGENLTIQMSGKMGKGLKLHETAAVSFVNTDGSGAVYIDSGIVFWDYYDDGEPGTGNMDGTFVPKRRYYIAPGRVQSWKRSIYGKWQSAFYGCTATPWEAMKNVTEPFQRNWMYDFDGTGMFIGLEKIRGSALKYCAIEKYYSDEFGFGIEDGDSIYNSRQPLLYVPQYLAEAAMRPQIEMAVKLGMNEAVRQLLDGNKNTRHINWKADRPQDFLRLTKTETREFLRDPSMKLLRWYHEAKPEGRIKNIEEAREVLKTFSESYIDNVLALCGKYGISLKRAMNYLKYPQRAGEWVDYVEMTEKLNMDLNQGDVLMPKNLTERHDAAAAAIKAINDEAILTTYKKRLKSLERTYGFNYDGLTIVVPKTAAEIVREGKTLHHCVGGYADRHIKGTTTILFLRRERKPETPFITIELTDDGKIRQIHGYKNEGYPFSVNPALRYADWLATWQRWYRSGSKRNRAGAPVINERKAV